MSFYAGPSAHNSRMRHIKNENKTHRRVVKHVEETGEQATTLAALATYQWVEVAVQTRWDVVRPRSSQSVRAVTTLQQLVKPVWHLHSLYSFHLKHTLTTLTILPTDLFKYISYIYKVVQKTDNFWELINFATVNGRKACGMSIISKFYLEKNLHISTLKYFCLVCINAHYTWITLNLTKTRGFLTWAYSKSNSNDHRQT